MRMEPCASGTRPRPSICSSTSTRCLAAPCEVRQAAVCFSCSQGARPVLVSGQQAHCGWRRRPRVVCQGHPVGQVCALARAVNIITGHATAARRSAPSTDTPRRSTLSTSAPLGPWPSTLRASTHASQPLQRRHGQRGHAHGLLPRPALQAGPSEQGGICVLGPVLLSLGRTTRASST